MYLEGRVQVSFQKARLMLIAGVKAPFAVLPCLPDGKCCIHAIVRAFFPELDPTGAIHAQHVLELRRAILAFNLGHWDET